MALILCLDSSTSSCSAALHRDGILLGCEAIHTPNSAAAQLVVLAREVMTKSSVTMEELDAVAVSAGPGSYTGLRIAVATAKGICYARRIPMVAVNSLELMIEMARKHVKGNELLCPMIDARRMEVYTMLVAPDGRMLEEVSARVVEPSSYASWLKGHRILFFGTGSSKCKDIVKNPNAFFIDEIWPSAGFMGKLAEARFVDGAFEDIESFEPLYLKDFLIRKPKHLA